MVLHGIEIPRERIAAFRQANGIHPEIPWREIMGTRNRLVHGYDAVDYDIM